MALYDEEELRKENEKNRKTKRLILTGIILSIIIIIALIGVIAYLIYNPNKITVSLNGAVTQKLDSILDISKTEDGNTLIYTPIIDIATFLGYKSNYGGYITNTQSKDSCYVETDKEIIIFNLDSDIIYKLNKNNNSSEYETVKIVAPVTKKDENLYINIYGLRDAFNMSIPTMDEKTKKLYITTLDSLVIQGQKIAADKGYEGMDDTFTNQKALLDNMIVVVDKDKKMGVIDAKGNRILGTQYDQITYIQKKKAFQVKIDGKVGIIKSDGTISINPGYEELVLIDDENELYLSKVSSGLYGVINKIGNTVIYPEYDKIGVNIDNFKENGLKTGYILLNQLIPVQKDGKWGFYKIEITNNTDGTESIQCNRITDFIFDNIGCVSKSQGSLIYNLMAIEDYGLIVIEQNGKYGFMNIEGKPAGASFADIYIEVSEGKSDYYMITENGNKLNVIEELEKRGYKKISE